MTLGARSLVLTRPRTTGLLMDTHRGLTLCAHEQQLLAAPALAMLPVPCTSWFSLP